MTIHLSVTSHVLRDLGASYLNKHKGENRGNWLANSFFKRYIWSPWLVLLIFHSNTYFFLLGNFSLKINLFFKIKNYILFLLNISFKKGFNYKILVLENKIILLAQSHIKYELITTYKFLYKYIEFLDAIWLTFFKLKLFKTFFKKGF